MVSYTQFRDLTAVFSAGAGLTAVGEGFASKVFDQLMLLRFGEDRVLHWSDGFGQEFKKTYMQPIDGVEEGPSERNLAISYGAMKLAQSIEKIGPDVVTVCSLIAGADAEHGSALLRASRPTA